MLILAMGIMKLWPQTPTAIWLNRVLVDLPIRFIAKIERKHLFFAALAIICMMMITTLGPLDLAVYGMWDVAVYLDVVTAAIAVAAVARSRSVLLVVKAWVAARVVGRRPRSRAVRSPIRRAANDDDGDRRAVPGPTLVRLAA